MEPGPAEDQSWSRTGSEVSGEEGQEREVPKGCQIASLTTCSFVLAGLSSSSLTCFTVVTQRVQTAKLDTPWVGRAQLLEETESHPAASEQAYYTEA